MATLNQPSDEDKKNQNPNQPLSVSGTEGGGSNAGGTGASGAASPVQQSVAPQGQANFNDVSGYLNANQAGSQALGNQVASNLTNTFNQTKSGIDQSANAANSGIDSGYVHGNQDLINQVAANPTAASQDPNQVKAFQAQLNDSYTGPSTWGDYGTQQGKVAQAQQKGDLYKTAGGANVLSQEVEQANNQGYSAGINQLDSFLLSGNPGSYGQVQAASQPFSTLEDYLGAQNTAIGSNIQSAKDNAAKASQGALDAFTGANGTLTNLNNTVNQNAEKAKTAAQIQQQALAEGLANLYGGQAVDNTQTSLQGYGGSSTPWYNTTNYNVSGLSADNQAALGISGDQWKALQNALQQAGTSQYMTGHNFGAGSGTSQIDLGQFLNAYDPNAISAANVATPEQYQQMAAIQQLLGDKTPQNLALNPLNADQAGTAPTKNQFNYQAALDAAQKTAAQERKEAQDAANGLTSAADKAHADSQHHGGILNNPIVNPLAKYLTNPLLSVPTEIKKANQKLNAAKK